MTNLARHLDCIERAIETGRQMRAVETVLATLDALAVVRKCPCQLVGIDTNGSRKLSLVCTLVYDTRLLECLELSALRSLLVSKAQVADVISLSKNMRRELGVAAVFIHETVALGVDSNTAVVGEVLTQHRVVVGAMPSISLVRAHFLKRSAQLGSPLDALARSTGGYHAIGGRRLGAILGNHLVVVAKAAGRKHSIICNKCHVGTIGIHAIRTGHSTGIIQKQALDLAIGLNGNVLVSLHGIDERRGETGARAVSRMHTMRRLSIIQARINRPRDTVAFGPLNHVLGVFHHGIDKIGANAVVARTHDVHNTGTDAVDLIIFSKNLFLLRRADRRNLAAAHNGSAAEHAGLLAQNDLCALFRSGKCGTNTSTAAANNKHFGLNLVGRCLGKELCVLVCRLRLIGESERRATNNQRASRQSGAALEQAST